MKHASKILICLWLACSPLFAQESLHEAQRSLHQQMDDAVRQEQQGQYASAVQLIAQVMESGQLSSVELARANIMLGFANRGLGHYVAAANAFDRSLRILEHDPHQLADYAAALENYAGLYGDLGEFRPAEVMWEKALQLRRQTGDHADAARALLNLAELQVAEKPMRKARQYADDASKEMNLATDLLDDDRIAFMETQAWLTLKEGRVSASVTGFRSALELCIRAHGHDHWLTGWDYVLLGKAHSLMGDSESALAEMQEGVRILENALGERNPKSLWSQVLYSQMLERAGMGARAAQIKAAIAPAIKDLDASGCPGCTINVAGFR
jgi:tetratricopeptide (TPR) repeat protein